MFKKGSKAKFATSCRNAFVTCVLQASVKMTLRISSLACFSAPWKRKPLFQRAMRIRGSFPCAHVSGDKDLPLKPPTSCGQHGSQYILYKSAPWKRKPLFRRAMRIQGSFPCARRLRRLELSTYRMY